MLTPDLLEHWRVETDHELITWLYLDVANSGVNVLSQAVLAEMESVLNEVIVERPKGLVIQSGKQRGFIAGADIREFVGVDKISAESIIQNAHRVMQKLDSLPVPTVAIVDGFCLGGGLELALACDYRLATTASSTRFAFPEVKLGIHPAFGGTARAVRTIGPMRALKMMLNGELIDAADARRYGLVHRLGNIEQLQDAARRRIHDAAEFSNMQAWPKCASHTWLRWLQSAWLGRKHRGGAARHYPAASEILELWRSSASAPDRLLAGEITSAARLMASETAQNLVYQHFCQNALRKACPVMEVKKFPPPKAVGVAGLNRKSIYLAALCIWKGMQVVIYDSRSGQVNHARRSIRNILRELGLDFEARQQAMSRLETMLPWKLVKTLDVVILSGRLSSDDLSLVAHGITEDALLVTADQEVSPDDVAKRLRKSGNLVALHLQTEPGRSELMEMVYGRFTARKWRHRACQFGHILGVTPLPVGKSPGFLSNRLLLPYWLEVLILKQEGVNDTVIRNVIQEIGMPRDPLDSIAELGIPSMLHLAEELDLDENHLPLSLTASYNASRQKTDLPARGEVKQRLLMALLNSAVNCLRKGVVDDARLLDAAAVAADAFPAYLGGPIRYIQTHGSEQLKHQLRILESRYGVRFLPDKGWDKSELFQDASNRPRKKSSV